MDIYLHLISKPTAKLIGMKRYFTGKPCVHGHISERYVCSGRCITCFDIARYENKEKHALAKRRSYDKKKDYYLDKAKRYRKENPDKVSKAKEKCRYNKHEQYRERAKEYRKENKEVISESKKEYYNRNKRKILIKNKKYREENKDKIQENYMLYYSKNRDLYIIRTAKRRAAKLERTLPMSDNHKSDIKHIYEQASLLRHLGYNYHVDHIIPLQGDFVSGLHVPWNLQIIPAEENLSKGNKFDMLIEVY